MVTAIDWQRVRTLAEQAEASGGTVGVAALAPDGAVFGYRADDVFVAASTIKVVIMQTIFRQIDADERSLEDRHPLTAADKATGGGILKHFRDGLPLTLHDLLVLMISISDNSATNMLIDLAGLERVNETARALGLARTHLGRKMFGRLARDGEVENTTTPLEMARAIEAILEGRAASAASCEAMLELLITQTNARRIARYLPQDAGIRWGSKTGSLSGVVNDAGFITTDAGTLIISVYTRGLPDPLAAEDVIGTISRAALTTVGL